MAVVLLAAAIPLAVAAYQIQSGADLFDAGGFGRATGTFTHSNPMAAFMTLVVVMAFAHVVHSDELRVQVWCGLAMAAAAVGLFVTYTRAAWLAAHPRHSRRRRRQGPALGGRSGRGAVDRPAHRARRDLTVLGPERGEHGQRPAEQLAELAGGLLGRGPRPRARQSDHRHRAQAGGHPERGRQAAAQRLPARLRRDGRGRPGGVHLDDLAVPQHRPPGHAGDPRRTRAGQGVRDRVRRLRRGLRAHVPGRQPDVAGRRRRLLRRLRRRRRSNCDGPQRLAGQEVETRRGRDEDEEVETECASCT